MLRLNQVYDMSEIKSMMTEMGEEAFIQHVVDNEFMFQPQRPREVHLVNEVEHLLNTEGWPLAFPVLSLESYYIRLESAYGTGEENFCTCRGVKVVKA